MGPSALATDGRQRHVESRRGLSRSASGGAVSTRSLSFLPSDADAARTKGSCTRCGEWGHYSRDCPQADAPWAALDRGHGLDRGSARWLPAAQRADQLAQAPLDGRGSGRPASFCWRSDGYEQQQQQQQQQQQLSLNPSQLVSVRSGSVSLPSQPPRGIDSRDLRPQLSTLSVPQDGSIVGYAIGGAGNYYEQTLPQGRSKSPANGFGHPPVPMNTPIMTRAAMPPGASDNSSDTSTAPPSDAERSPPQTSRQWRRSSAQRGARHPRRGHALPHASSDNAHLPSYGWSGPASSAHPHNAAPEAGYVHDYYSTSRPSSRGPDGHSSHVPYAHAATGEAALRAAQMLLASQALLLNSGAHGKSAFVRPEDPAARPCDEARHQQQLLQGDGGLVSSWLASVGNPLQPGYDLEARHSRVKDTRDMQHRQKKLQDEADVLLSELQKQRAELSKREDEVARQGRELADREGDVEREISRRVAQVSTALAAQQEQALQELERRHTLEKKALEDDLESKHDVLKRESSESLVSMLRTREAELTDKAENERAARDRATQEREKNLHLRIAAAEEAEKVKEEEFARAEHDIDARKKLVAEAETRVAAAQERLEQKSKSIADSEARLEKQSTELAALGKKLASCETQQKAREKAFDEEYTVIERRKAALEEREKAVQTHTNAIDSEKLQLAAVTAQIAAEREAAREKTDQLAAQEQSFAEAVADFKKEVEEHREVAEAKTKQLHEHEASARDELQRAKKRWADEVDERARELRAWDDELKKTRAVLTAETARIKEQCDKAEAAANQVAKRDAASVAMEDNALSKEAAAERAIKKLEEEMALLEKQRFAAEEMYAKISMERDQAETTKYLARDAESVMKRNDLEAIELREARQQLESEKEKFAAEKSDMLDGQRRLAQQQADLTSRSNKLARIEAELRDLDDQRRQVESLSLAVETARMDLIIEQERVAHDKAELTAIEEERKKLLSDRQRVEALIPRESELLSLQTEINDRFDSLEAEQKLFDAELDDLHREKTALQKEAAAVQEKTGALVELERHLTEIEGMLEKKRTALSAREAEAQAAASDAAEERAALLREVTALRLQKTTADELVGRLNHEIAQLRHAAGSAHLVENFPHLPPHVLSAIHLEPADSGAGGAASLRAAVARLQGDLAIAQTDNSHLRAKVDAVEVAKASLEEQLDLLQQPASEAYTREHTLPQFLDKRGVPMQAKGDRANWLVGLERAVRRDLEDAFEHVLAEVVAAAQNPAPPALLTRRVSSQQLSLSFSLAKAAEHAGDANHRPPGSSDADSETEGPTPHLLQCYSSSAGSACLLHTSTAGSGKVVQPSSQPTSRTSGVTAKSRFSSPRGSSDRVSSVNPDATLPQRHGSPCFSTGTRAVDERPPLLLHDPAPANPPHNESYALSDAGSSCRLDKNISFRSSPTLRPQTPVWSSLDTYPTLMDNLYMSRKKDNADFEEAFAKLNQRVILDAEYATYIGISMAKESANIKRENEELVKANNELQKEKFDVQHQVSGLLSSNRVYEVQSQYTEEELRILTSGQQTWENRIDEQRKNGAWFEGELMVALKKNKALEELTKKFAFSTVFSALRWFQYCQLLSCFAKLRLHATCRVLTHVSRQRDICRDAATRTLGSRENVVLGKYYRLLEKNLYKRKRWVPLRKSVCRQHLNIRYHTWLSFISANFLKRRKSRTAGLLRDLKLTMGTRGQRAARRLSSSMKDCPDDVRLVQRFSSRILPGD
ncbi:hypothetical protein DIPPA_27583 [Diplonema papillatum]|nr:hypothetical protein DIPPA_27583 [Diplonema papillatum]